MLAYAFTWNQGEETSPLRKSSFVNRYSIFILFWNNEHFIMCLPENETDYSTRISAMKGKFTRTFLENRKSDGFGSGHRGKGERTVWQH